MKILTLTSLVLIAAVLGNRGTASGAAAEEMQQQDADQQNAVENADPIPAEPAAAVPSEEEDWVAKYLSEKLKYEEDQVREFKANVADMPQERLESLLRQLRTAETQDAAQASAVFHRRNLDRLNVARSDAIHRGSPQAPVLGYGLRERRTHTRWYHAPGNYGLFRGYTVWLTPD